MSIHIIISAHDDFRKLKKERMKIIKEEDVFVEIIQCHKSPSMSSRKQSWRTSPSLKLIMISAVCLAILLSLLSEARIVVLLNSTDSSLPANNFTDTEAAFSTPLESEGIPKARRKRYISQNDMIAILDYHNQVRGKVFPPAANMEYMVWDENLAKSAEAWAATCIWDHGPSYLLRFLGQNLSVRTGRYRSILQLVKPWYDEVKDYAFPYPQDCNPQCPMRCFGPMCTHYTQMVWATSNRIGCAVHTCQNMNVWGSVWRRAVYLVCNYAPKGNWIGEAPYKVGVPCSSCPPSYGGACTDNLCFPGVTTNYLYWFK
ncbi:peptidase inhibitor 15 [Apodemus sylvaticus]|uniref:peptidase inhibitor 15 n=1 Tax=Apodemus sylvaticus TaxID=10129 RepID=UPI002242E7A7|nr:peptidase inhibitor 15 [Apodemus sylvaticus]